jgi:hypothetical protein
VWAIALNYIMQDADAFVWFDPSFNRRVFYFTAIVGKFIRFVFLFYSYRFTLLNLNLRTFNGLDSAAKIWLRIIVIDKNGESTYWEPVSRIVQVILLFTIGPGSIAGALL